MTTSRLFTTLGLLLCGAIAFAETSTASQTEVRTLLLKGEFSTLDQRFGNLQSAYTAGTLSEDELRSAFRVFYDSDAALKTAFERWVAQSPKSYVAHLARGIYYKNVGTKQRGSAWASNTSEKQFAAMKASHTGWRQSRSVTVKAPPLPRYRSSPSPMRRSLRRK